jgi:hypothetical protein
MLWGFFFGLSDSGRIFWDFWFFLGFFLRQFPKSLSFGVQGFVLRADWRSIFRETGFNGGVNFEHPKVAKFLVN